MASEKTVLFRLLCGTLGEKGQGDRTLVTRSTRSTRSDCDISGCRRTKKVWMKEDEAIPSDYLSDKQKPPEMRLDDL